MIKAQLVALPLHEFGLINVTGYGGKHQKLKESNVRSMLKIHMKKWRRLMLEVLASHLVWI